MTPVPGHLHVIALQGGEPRERERHAVGARLQALDAVLPGGIGRRRPGLFNQCWARSFDGDAGQHGARSVLDGAGEGHLGPRGAGKYHGYPYQYQDPEYRAHAYLIDIDSFVESLALRLAKIPGHKTAPPPRGRATEEGRRRPPTPPQFLHDGGPPFKKKPTPPGRTPGGEQTATPQPLKGGPPGQFLLNKIFGEPRRGVAEEELGGLEFENLKINWSLWGVHRGKIKFFLLKSTTLCRKCARRLSRIT